MMTPPLPQASQFQGFYPFSEEIVPNTQSKPPLVQLGAISSYPVPFSLGKESDLASPSCQGLEESSNAPLILLFSRLQHHPIENPLT